MNDLERRQLAAMWEMANMGGMDLEDCQRKWNEVKARHGFAPDGTEKPQPASEGVRWFRSREVPAWSYKFYGDGSCMKMFRELDHGPYVLMLRDAERMAARGELVELDGPPPHGKPLAKPATEGDELKERYFVWARQAPERKYESWADAVPFARSEIARATAPLVKERDKLRAKLARLKPTRRKSKPRKGKGVKRGR